MNQILIGKNLAYAAKAGGGTISGYKEVDLLADGAIAIFTEAGNLITTGNIATILNDQKRVYFVSGSNKNDGASPLPAPDVSVQVIRDRANFEAQVYKAPVQCVKFVGSNGTSGSLNLPSPLIAGTEVFIRITDTTLGLRTTGDNIKRYSELVTASDTATTLITRLIADINADVDSIVTAVLVGSGAGIQLTAKGVGTMFKVSVDGVIATADIDEVESPVAGTSAAVAEFAGAGTAAQIAALEDAFSAQKGNKNKVYLSGLWWTKASKVVSTETYYTYVITWTGEKKVATGRLDTINHELIVAIPVEAAANATVQGFFDNIFNVETSIETGS